MQTNPGNSQNIHDFQTKFGCQSSIFGRGFSNLGNMAVKSTAGYGNIDLHAIDTVKMGFLYKFCSIQIYIRFKGTVQRNLAGV